MEKSKKGYNSIEVSFIFGPLDGLIEIISDAEEEWYEPTSKYKSPDLVHRYKKKGKQFVYAGIVKKPTILE